MIKNNVNKKYYIKNISYRVTEKGMYIIYAFKSELLLVEEKIIKNIISHKNQEIKPNNELFEILLKNNFLTNNIYENKNLPIEPKGRVFRNTQKYFLLLYLIAVVIIIFKSNTLIYCIKNFITIKGNIFILIVSGILFSLFTTLLHELMHVYFSNNLSNLKNIFKLSLKKSTIFVSLTHVWTWSLYSRLIAISSGIMMDTFILAFLLIIQQYYGNQILVLFSIIMFLRIIWQFRVNRITDSRYFIMMLLDNPFINIDYKSDIEGLTLKERYIWKSSKIISVVVEMFLLIFFLAFIISKFIL